MLTVEGCRTRQGRLLRAMEEARVDAAVLSRPKSVYYFSGALVDEGWPQTFVMKASGDCTLVTNLAPKTEVAAAVKTYTGYTLERAFGRESGHDELVAIIRDLVPRGSVGIEREFISGGLFAAFERQAHNLTPTLIEMRRRKDPDELECMRATTRLTEAGYRAIKDSLEPGMTEVQAYLIIEAAIESAAETSVDLKGDFACGVRAINGGGPPTSRRVQRGDLYIFDLFPKHRGYMCDLCRTFAAGPPTAEQQEAWAHVMAGHDLALRLIRPGASTRAVYEQIRHHLEQYAPARGSFNHHAGHGVGMDGWEQPWLNAGSDQTFIEGEVIACEPGLYAQSLNGGIRLEHNYLVTADGPVPLDSFPMDL